MHLVPDYEETSSTSQKEHHRLRWTVLSVSTLLILANWKLVVAALAITAATLIVFGLFVSVVFIRKVTRPLGQLSLFDVAIVTWVYRRWESIKSRR
jgi:hypothetical protein